MEKKDYQNPVFVLFSFAGEMKGKMTLSIILAVAGELAGMLPFLAAAMLANEVFAGTAALERAVFWAVLAALGIVLRTVLCTLSSARSHKIAFTILKNMRRAIADKLRRVPMGVVLETPTGVLKTLMVDNVGKLEDSIAHVVPEAPSQVAAPLACMVLIFILDWRMGLASLLTIPLSVPFIIAMMSGYGEKMETFLRSGNEMNAALVEYVGGIQVIKAFGRTGASFGKFSDAVGFFHDSTLAWWHQCWLWMAAVKALIPTTMLGTLPIGLLLYRSGQITLPVLIACIVIPIGFIAPMTKLAFGGEQLTVIAANLKPIREFLAIPEQVRPGRKAHLDGSAYSFEQVSFSYDASREVLHEISFCVEPGTMTAIVGPSGSGKSTIAKLMAGFWDASSGVVRYGGADIRQIPFDQMMGEISYVAQDRAESDGMMAAISAEAANKEAANKEAANEEAANEEAAFGAGEEELVC